MTNDSDGRETRRRGANAQTTIHDVARLAKVSIGTVSKALNRGGRLKAETRERVIAAAKQLAFRPNDLAQSLHRGRSLTVGLISKDNFGRFAMPIMEGPNLLQLPGQPVDRTRFRRSGDPSHRQRFV